MLDNYSAGMKSFNHSQGGWFNAQPGSNVLYLDGHVEFVPYEENGKGPVNRRFSTMLDLLHAIAEYTN